MGRDFAFLGKTDPEQFEALLAPQLENAYRFAYQLTRNDADAEDLLQDACQQSFAKFSLFKKGTNFKAWLFRIIRNLHIDQLRRKMKEPEPDALRTHYATQVNEEVLEEVYKSSRARGARGVLENEEIFYDLFGDEVNRFLLELPAEFRAALLLCDLEGFSYQEISDVLECPIGTVRSRISRARSYLKEKLYQYAKTLGYVKESN